MSGNNKLVAPEAVTLSAKLVFQDNVVVGSSHRSVQQSPLEEDDAEVRFSRETAGSSAVAWFY